jgi:hypothetical protein
MVLLSGIVNEELAGWANGKTAARERICVAGYVSCK